MLSLRTGRAVTANKCTEKCAARVKLLVVYHLPNVFTKSERKVNREDAFLVRSSGKFSGATEHLKR